MSQNPTIVVLAAGRGTRFEGASHKLEQSLGSASVLGSTLRAALESRLPLVVVTTPPLAPLASRWVASNDVIVVSEAEARLGMGHTLATGVAARASAPGWLVMLGDMPLVKPSTLRLVAAALQHHPVVYAQHQGRRGHPVGFAAELYSELVLLTGDDGARRIVARYPAHGVDVDDPGVLLDIDTEADLARARAMSAAGHPSQLAGA